MPHNQTQPLSEMWDSVRRVNLASAIPNYIYSLSKEDSRHTFSTYTENCMEHVHTAGGIKYVNDSRSCNVNAVWYTLQSIVGPIVWIAGGVTTQQAHEWDELTMLIKKKVTHIIVMGTHWQHIVAKFGKCVTAIVRVDTMEQAVYMARLLSNPGHTVLLSPGMASFDMFNDLKERGERFKEAVLNVRR